MGVRGFLGFLAETYRLQIATILEYRFSFLSQSFGMFVNDLFWVFFWFIIFDRFKSINGWSFSDILILYAIFAGSFALVGIFLNNVHSLASTIENGGLDYYLSLPKPILLNAMMSTSYSSFGDLVFGLILAGYALPLVKLPLYFLLLVTGMMVFVSWSILIGSVTFYVGRFEKAARAARDILTIFAGYPFSVYSGMSRFVLLFLIPVGMISGVPVELLRSFSWEWFLILMVFTTVFFTLAVSFFYIGLRRYSSGNTMGMRG